MTTSVRKSTSKSVLRRRSGNALRSLYLHMQVEGTEGLTMVYYDHHNNTGRSQLPLKPTPEECAYFDAIMELRALGYTWAHRNLLRRIGRVVLP
jgi:hypothetical protein